jgi:hypothetical protein
LCGRFQTGQDDASPICRSIQASAYQSIPHGDLHSSKKEIQYIQCRTCHGTPTALPLTKTLMYPDDLAFKLAFLNPVLNLTAGDTILVTEQGDPLWNTRVLPDGTY